MNKRKLLKQIGLKSTMKMRDFIQFRMDEDRKNDYKWLSEELEIKYGDMVTIITHSPPKLKRHYKLLSGLQPKRKYGNK